MESKNLSNIQFDNINNLLQSHCNTKHNNNKNMNHVKWSEVKLVTTTNDDADNLSFDHVVV